MSDSLWPKGLQQARLLCPLLSPRICSSSCPLSWWCYLTISSSATLFSLLPSIFPSIRVFSSKSVLGISGQSTGASASASVLPMNIHSWFPLACISLISLQSKGVSRVFSSTIQSINSSVFSLPYSPTHIQTRLLEKPSGSVHAKSLSCVWLFSIPWTEAHHVPPSMRFSR